MITSNPQKMLVAHFFSLMYRGVTVPSLNS
jgi:hypothetical protein